MRDRLALAYIVSDKDDHFSGNIAVNAMEFESLLLPSDWRSLQINECVIESVSIQSIQLRDFQVFLFAKSTAEDTTDMDLDEFVDYFNFQGESAEQLGGGDQFYYPSPDNHVSVPYRDDDLTGKIHVGLVNKSGQAKSSGASGYVKVRITARPIFGG